MWVDSHCHLDFPDFAPERDAVVARAREAGVGTMLTISTKVSTFAQVHEVAEAYDDVWCSAGVHPHEAAAEPAAADVEGLVALTRRPRVVALGETGLDYYYEHSPREAQKAGFRAHLEAAREAGVPVVVHSRNADADTEALLREACGQGGVTGVMHCFSAGRGLAEAALELGFYISLSGIVTFKNAEALRAIAREVPVDRLLVETDAPYLAPVPKRGRRNEPAFVVHTGHKVAELKDMAPEALARATTDNFFRLFPRARRAETPCA